MIANVQIEILLNVQNELSNFRLYFMGGDALRECTSQCERAKFWAINLNWVIGIICKYRFGSWVECNQEINVVLIYREHIKSMLQIRYSLGYCIHISRKVTCLLWITSIKFSDWNITFYRKICDFKLCRVN